MQNLQTFADEMNALVVDSFRGEPVTRGELLAAFNSVADKANWKNKIDARVTLADDRARYVMRQAVVFFAGCVPEVFETLDAGVYRVMAAGYYEAVGA